MTIGWRLVFGGALLVSIAALAWWGWRQGGLQLLQLGVGIC